MEHLGKLKVPGVGQAMKQLFPLLGLVTVIRQTMPPEGLEVLNYCRRALSGMLNPFCLLTINEFEGSLPNDLYKDIHLHLESCKAYNKAQRVTLFRKPNNTTVTMRLANSSDIIVDVFKGMTVWWTHHEKSRDNNIYRGPYGGHTGSTSRNFQLKIRKRDKARLLSEYLDFITRNSSTYSGKTRDIKIFTNSDHSHHFLMNGSRRMWEEIPYKHPSTFDTLAIDPLLKEKIMGDLTSFTLDQSFYERTGRAWKRGYLLYGPPGTGKSSMIAAMANFLKYDIYDLELSQVHTNGDLRQLLIQTSNRSIIVLEDIDCSVNFTSSRTGRGRGRNAGMMILPGDPMTSEDDPNRVTLSGLLNFVDGLWSCCGDERIFVFTTNHVEKLDKALLRPGRMDMQIELSYCTFSAFKVLVHNYLSTDVHPLFGEVEAAFAGKTMTPAQIAELLIKEKGNVDIALESVITALRNNVPESPTPECANDKEPLPTDLAVSGEGKSPIERNNPISTLQEVIDVTQKSPDSLFASQDARRRNIQEVAKPETSTVKQELESSSSTMKDLVQSIRAILKKNAGDIDSTIEGIIQALPNKLPNSDMNHLNAAVAEPANGSVNGRSGTSAFKAASNGVCRETENGEIK